MLSNKDKGHLRRVRKTAYKLNLPEEVVEQTLHYMSEYIKKKISEVDVCPDVMLTEEEFEKKLPIIKIPHMGYLKPSYYKYKQIHTRAKQSRLKKLNKEEVKNE